ncbi:hypothetical protein, partial [Dysgonomonas sp. 520]|uniref:hypothetical protein n=1 Tax=Dysgonomonas sp. 520 TaxID=2302931 RepID=UPI0013D14C26
GNATWQVNVGNQNSLYRKFAAATAKDVSLPGNTVVAFPGIGTYTAQNSGKYQVFYHSFLYSATAGMKSFYFNIQRNGTSISSDETYAYVAIGSWFNTHYSTVVSLNAGDVISFSIRTLVGAPLVITSSNAFRNTIEVIFLGI